MVRVEIRGCKEGQHNEHICVNLNKLTNIMCRVGNIKPRDSEIEKNINQLMRVAKGSPMSSVTFL